MSLRCWTCDVRWPSAWGSRLFRSRPLLKGLIRALVLALQERVQGGVPVGHPAMLWFVEHAGELLA
eukprot:5862222-Alexandrium_andersonii.AAC.1